VDVCVCVCACACVCGCECMYMNILNKIIINLLIPVNRIVLHIQEPYWYSMIAAFMCMCMCMCKYVCVCLCVCVCVCVCVCLCVCVCVYIVYINYVELQRICIERTQRKEPSLMEGAVGRLKIPNHPRNRKYVEGSIPAFYVFHTGRALMGLWVCVCVCVSSKP
jgi:hypothetical protein